VALVSFVACGWLDPAEPDVPDPDPSEVTVLFIGSSYFGSNNMPGIFKSLASAAGHQTFVYPQVIPGNYLDYFADDPQTEAVIESHAWDYVILQGGIQNAAYPETHHLITPSSGYHPLFPALHKLEAKITANHPDTKTVYMMPWAFEDGMTWVEGQTDTYVDMQLLIRENTKPYADEIGLILAPVGMAWYEVLKDPGPEHYLHSADWNHPNYRGSFLSAAVIVSTVFAQSVENAAFQGSLPAAEADQFREIASRTVLDSLEVWNIQP
jgi:hypothetical protein